MNFGKRGISTSIGVRGAHVTYGPAGTRTTVGLPGSGLSYTHLEKPHHNVSTPTAAEPPPDPGTPQGSAVRGLLWMGLILAAIVVAIIRLLTPPAPPVQIPTPQRVMAQAASKGAAPAADAEKSAHVKTAALGLIQIRHSVANSSTLKLLWVSVMPKGAICYRFQLRNSRGVIYVRTAVKNGAALNASGSDGFTALWNGQCAHQHDGLDITADVEDRSRLSMN